MQTDSEKIMHAADFMYKSQGYVDTALTAKMSGIPAMVVANILEQNNFIVSGRKGQYIKKKVNKDISSVSLPRRGTENLASI